MADVYLGFETAWEYWRAVGSGIAPWPQWTDVRGVSGETNLDAEIIAANPKFRRVDRAPTHVLVSSRNKHHCTHQVRRHACTQMLPAGSFFRIFDDVLIASPALCLLQAAQRSKPTEMLPFLELCMEFLGGYSLCEGIPRGFMRHQPFLDMNTLVSFAGQLPPRTRGMVMLEKALRLVRHNSWSPRETSSFLMLTLPVKLGGYGLPKPVLNFPVPHSPQPLFLDLYWEGTSAAFEYDGSDHLDPQKVAEDKARRNLLAALGYRIIVVEKSHLENIRLLNQQIALLAGMIGTELEEASPKELDARRNLRGYLFGARHHWSSPLTRPIILPPAG